MKHLHIAALEPDAAFAKRMGKKASESDFAIYNCKVQEEAVLSIYHPSKYPEKIQPLLYSLSLCDAAYFCPSSIDKAAGEMLVAASSFGKKLIVIPDLVGREAIEPMLKAAGGFPYEFFEGDALSLQGLLAACPSLRKQEGKTEVVIDACFPVKGVGTVALGIVQQGKVRVHQKLHLLPLGVQAEVKSIQVQDVDVEEADAGCRVGLCLRGVEPQKVERGTVAAEENFPLATKIEASFELSKYYKGSLESQFFILSGIKFVSCKARRLEGSRFELELGAPFFIREGEYVFAFFPDSMPRAIGRAKVEKIVQSVGPL